MTRIFGRYVSLEMILLCLVELLLSFVVIYAMLVSSAGLEGPVGLRPLGAGLAAVLAFTIGGTALTIGLYRPEVCLERRRLLLNATVAGLLAFPAVLAVSETLHVNLSLFYLMWLAKVLLAWVVCLLFTRWVFGFPAMRRLFVRKILVLGTGSRAASIAGVVRSHRGRYFDLVAPMAPADAAGTSWITPGAMREQRIWGVVVAGGAQDSLPTHEMQDLLACKLRGVRVFDDVRFREQHLGQIDLDNIDRSWLLFNEGFSSNRIEDAVRRVFDVVMGLLFLVATLPVMLLAAVAIKLDSPGPVLYRQERVGLHGRVFTLMKFRSMRVDAEAGGRPRWAAQKDPRVTRVGAFIRLTRIDELPQLICVLRGQMSFIGPRPERPHFVEQLSELIPFYQERTTVKPGITGWAQVNYPYGASVEDARQKLSYDLYYVKNRSLFLDLVILLSTVRVILFQEGAR